MARRRGHHRWLAALAVVLALVLLGGFFASRVVGYVFQSRVTRLIAQRTHVQVEFGTVLYRPPYAFYATDFHVIVPRKDGGESQRFAAGSMMVDLGRFPRTGDPVSIPRLVVRHAVFDYGAGAHTVAMDRAELSFHETRERGTFEGRISIGDGPAGTIGAEGNFDANARELRLAKIEGSLRLAPLLTRVPVPQRAEPAMELTSPDGKIAISGSATLPLGDLSRADYELTVDLQNVSGRIPQIKANLEQGGGRIRIRPSKSDALAIEASIESMHVVSNKGGIELYGGIATLYPGKGTWDLSQVVGTVRLGNELPLFLPNSGWFFNEGRFNGPIQFALAASGPLHLGGRSPFEAIHHEVLAYPRDVSVRPRNFMAPIEHITGGPIAFRGGVVTFQNLAGSYGKDKLLLRNARLTLEDPDRRIALEDLQTQVKFEEIAGTVVFDRSSPSYPGVVGKTVAQLQPRGPFVIGGGTWYAINRPPRNQPWVKFKPDFFVRLLGDGGSFAVGKYGVPFTEIQGESTIAPMSVEIRGFAAKSLGGGAWAEGQIVPGRPFLYHGQIDARDMDLAELAKFLPLEGEARDRLTGTAALSFKVAGAGRGGAQGPSQTLVADGDWEVLHGDFWSVPAVHDVANRVRKTEELGTGDAAGVMHIARETITLESAAINSPLLGLQGHGTIGFDKSLDLTVVAAPLGDWRDRMRQAGIPVVGDVLGAVQQLMNAAQGTLLYQFRVTGSLAKPSESLIPAPVITQPVAYLFGQMLKQDQSGQLLADVKRQPPSVAADAAGQAQPASARQAGAK